VWDVTKRRSVKPQLEFMFDAHCGHGGLDDGDDEPEILCICYYDALDDDDARKCFVTGGNGGKMRLWNLGNYNLEGALVGHTEAVTCLALDASFLFSGSEDCTIKVRER
jgi:WD40 repeat protein